MLNVPRFSQPNFGVQTLFPNWRLKYGFRTKWQFDIRKTWEYKFITLIIFIIHTFNDYNMMGKRTWPEKLMRSQNDQVEHFIWPQIGSILVNFNTNFEWNSKNYHIKIFKIESYQGSTDRMPVYFSTSPYMKSWNEKMFKSAKYHGTSRSHDRLRLTAVIRIIKLCFIEKQKSCWHWNWS